MIIKRNRYLEQLINKKNNGLIKIITGLRRAGKSYLLNNLYKEYLLNNGIKESQIITFSFDDLENAMKLDKYLPNEDALFFNSKNNYLVNPKKFILYINELTKENNTYYLFLDEIHLLDNFLMVLNSSIKHENFDVYVIRFLNNNYYKF